MSGIKKIWNSRSTFYTYLREIEDAEFHLTYDGTNFLSFCTKSGILRRMWRMMNSGRVIDAITSEYTSVQNDPMFWKDYGACITRVHSNRISAIIRMCGARFKNFSGLRHFRKCCRTKLFKYFSFSLFLFLLIKHITHDELQITIKLWGQSKSNCMFFRVQMKGERFARNEFINKIDILFDFRQLSAVKTVRKRSKIYISLMSSLANCRCSKDSSHR